MIRLAAAIAILAPIVYMRVMFGPSPRLMMCVGCYTDAQIDSLVALLRWLSLEVPSLRDIAGHEDLDTTTVPATDDPDVLVQRKRDPGPRFPWQQVLDAITLQRVP